MFQTFDAPDTLSATGQRMADVRALMRDAKIDAYLVPRADAHQGEYVPASAERLKWLTGFSGSAGFAVIALKRAAVFVDGRYTVQARAEINQDLFEIINFPKTRPENWLASELAKSKIVIGFDPWLHTPAEITRITKAVAQTGAILKPLTRKNLIDKAWGNSRPAEPLKQVCVHPLKYAGRSSTDKITDIQEELKADGHNATVLTLPDSICWLLNFRGSDVVHNPVALCYAIVPARGKVELFITPDKLDDNLRTYLKPVARIFPTDKLQERIKELGTKNKTVRIDPATAPMWFEIKLKKSQIVHAPDPCVMRKAIKNKVETQGARKAHVRDGIAVVQFLTWLDAHTPTGNIDEIQAAKQLEQFRADTGELRDISFDTISGAGPNGAIVHYRVTEATNRKLKSGELYLVDSGAQYQDGTTDITRTVAIGEPTNEMRDRFTRVLKGHIAIATVKFPQGTRGVDLDPFARRSLWGAGLDYAHGTGHGVGSFLSVHEGPASISRAGAVALEPGMILSNEPGYYKEGHYGIRIENLVLVQHPETPEAGEKGMLSFETLTLAPIDRNLIDKRLLDADEIKWIDTYHARIFETLSANLDTQTRAWLKAATAPL